MTATGSLHLRRRVSLQTGFGIFAANSSCARSPSRGVVAAGFHRGRRAQRFRTLSSLDRNFSSISVVIPGCFIIQQLVPYDQSPARSVIVGAETRRRPRAPRVPQWVRNSDRKSLSTPDDRSSVTSNVLSIHQSARAYRGSVCYCCCAAAVVG